MSSAVVLSQDAGEIVGRSSAEIFFLEMFVKKKAATQNIFWSVEVQVYEGNDGSCWSGTGPKSSATVNAALLCEVGLIQTAEKVAIRITNGLQSGMR